MTNFYKRYIYKNGVKHGPYYYSNKKVNGKVISTYLGTKPPKSEDKLIQCIKGSIFDVVIDLRNNSKTYGQWMGKVMDTNSKMLLVPKGCAHGFQALEDNTIIQYPVSEYYSPKDEMGVRWNDPLFHIKWPIKKVIVSEKDSKWPNFILQKKS